MTDQPMRRLLTLNLGSSSLKAGLYQLAPAPRLELVAAADHLGHPESHVDLRNAGGDALPDAPIAHDFDSALQAVLAWLADHGRDTGLAAVGHRVVHGGRDYRTPQVVTPDLLATLQRLIPLDPEHLPQTLSAIHTVQASYPTVPQVACFDTAFHHDMPLVAQRYALPRSLIDAGVVRYGFHGLSYEYVLQALRALDPGAAAGRVIIAHLGNGASMAAVRGGASLDTTMGFTPTGGLVMGTRSGDLDPGVLVYLLTSQGLSREALSSLVNQKAGLLGVSGTSGDVRKLLARAPTDPRAAEALDLFCYQAKKFLGALTAVVGGLDTLVFTGGIGEHAAPVRERICDGLGFLGVALDPARNAAHAPVISPEGSVVKVRVMKTDEDLMVARHTYEVLQAREGGHVPV
jgi:acetate kinase